MGKTNMSKTHSKTEKLMQNISFKVKYHLAHVPFRPKLIFKEIQTEKRKPIKSKHQSNLQTVESKSYTPFFSKIKNKIEDQDDLPELRHFSSLSCFYFFIEFQYRLPSGKEDYYFTWESSLL